MPSSTKKEQVQITVQGRVHGVYYRSFVQDTAKKLGVIGTARNAYEKGSVVEIIAQGTHENLEKLIRECWRGSPSARVDYITAKYKPATKKFKAFEIQD